MFYRHAADEDRQFRLAKRRVQIRQQRLLQKDIKHKEQNQTPADGMEGCIYKLFPTHV